MFAMLFQYLCAPLGTCSSAHGSRAVCTSGKNMYLKKQFYTFFDHFHNSVLKLHVETGKNGVNETAQDGASKGPDEKSKELYFLCFFNTFAHLLALAGLLATHTRCKHT